MTDAQGSKLINLTGLQLFWNKVVNPKIETKADADVVERLSTAVDGKADKSVVDDITDRLDEFGSTGKTIEKVIESIAASAGVASIQGGDEDGDLVKVGVSGNTGAVIISIDDANLQTALGAKASQEDLGALGTTVTNLGNTVAGKANQTDLEALGTAVTNLGSTVAGKANQTDLEVAEGEINTLKEAVNALSSATDFIGVTTTELADEAATNPIKIDGEDYTASKGDIVIYESKEFIWDSTKWIELGDTTALAQAVAAIQPLSDKEITDAFTEIWPNPEV